jgi:predicted membrane protein
LVGSALLLRNSGFPLPYWLFSWPMLLIVIGIYSGFKHSFKNNSWLILIGVGGFFLIDRFAPEVRLAANFWPVIIIAVGVLFIMRPDRNRWIGIVRKNNEPDNVTETGWQQADSTANFTTDTSDFLKVSSVFSGIERNIVSKNFQGGKISCVFGGADIDFTQADIQGKKEIRFEVVFGGVKLIVPPNWVVYNQIEGVFHGVEDKRRYDAATSATPEKVLVLKGSVIFGGVEIRSY